MSFELHQRQAPHSARNRLAFTRVLHSTRLGAGMALAMVMLIAAVAGASSSAPAFKRVPGESNITIQGWMSPAGSFQGGCVDENCSGLQIVDKGDKIALSIKFSDIQVGSGIVFGIRTKEMRKFFGEGSRISLVIPKPEISKDGKRLMTTTGTLSLKDGGKSVQKKVSYVVKKTGKTYEISKGAFDIDLQQDFGIDTRQRIRKLSVYVKPHIAVRDVEFTLEE